MRPIDLLILVLFLPAVLFGIGGLYVFENNLCGPMSSIFCLGFNWVSDVVIVPLVIFTFSAGMFFFCRRCKTERL